MECGKESGDVLCRKGCFNAGVCGSLQVFVNVCTAGSAPWLVHFHPGEGIEIR